MCILIVLRGWHPEHPLVLASNRDERRDRPASPPGLWIGERSRLLSPRDRRGGGTWFAIDDRGRFAAITNLAGIPPVPDAPSRGLLPHLVLDHPDLGAGIEAVKARVAEHAHAGFQLVVGDAQALFVLRHAHGQVSTIEWVQPLLVVTNEHEPGKLDPRGLSPALLPNVDLPRRLDLLANVLRDRGGDGRHAICKRGDTYGTVSSSLVAVPAADPLALIWRYAPGPPDITEYRNYGNLGRRLLPEPEEP